MSGSDYSSHETFSKPSYASAKSEEERNRLEEDRRGRVESYKSGVSEKSSVKREVRDVSKYYDMSMVRSSITRPAPGIKRVYVFLIDNSGSNRKIADHFKKSSNYLRINLQILDPEAQFVFIYFSDHGDGEAWWQAVDFISADEPGEKILTSTICEIRDANGYDAPEAHECALKKACEINFGEVAERHLILVSDVVGHGMGMRSDDGCPYQQDWRDSLDLVEKTYQTFELIGCGDNEDLVEIQKKFINHLHPELVSQNFISLSHVAEHHHRLGLVLNSTLLLVARHRGIQGIESFLSRLYEKWLYDPIFGDNTDRKAKEAILRFAKYISCDEEEKIKMMSRILVMSHPDIEAIIKRNGISI